MYNFFIKIQKTKTTHWVMWFSVDCQGCANAHLLALDSQQKTRQTINSGACPRLFTRGARTRKQGQKAVAFARQSPPSGEPRGLALVLARAKVRAGQGARRGSRTTSGEQGVRSRAGIARNACP